jgi:PncC family amidohydrolase
MADQPLEAYVGALLRQRGMTLATAESCTGGLLGHRLTNVPGSSDYYLGGVIVYADAAKVTLLGVDRNVLAREGAVSEAVARQMALGVCRRLHADLGVGITGIAGPAGGTAGKPVGLVYIALAAAGVVRCERHVWPHDREGNKAVSVQRALEMMKEHLESL